ncbi:hypothetical protein EOM89_13060, partial [Candidatus Falkowbacteria bacterium]|nr:hypothetical protein [Candidatus Falkowbacteria bacterium]
TAIYIGFGFERQPAVAAAGVATFSRISATPDDALLILQGTRLVTPGGAYFVTDADVTIPAGASTAHVTVTAAVPGAAGNAPANSLLVAAGSSYYTVTNHAILSGGQDAETEEQRAERFAAFVRALARGTPAALEYAATLPVRYHPVTGVLAERVQRAAVYETPGYVALYIHNGSYGASSALVQAVQDTVDGVRDPELDAWLGGYRPAGMRVVVQAMTDLPVDVALELTVGIGLSQADLAAALEAKLAAWLRSVMPGRQVRPIDLINLALGVEGVTMATLIAPITSFTVAASTVLSLRTLTLTWTA